MSEYADEYIRRSMRINRATIGEAAKSAKKLRTTHEKISKILQSLERGGFSVADKNRAIIQISRLLQVEYLRQSQDAIKVAEEFVQMEIDWQMSTVVKYTTAAVNVIPAENAVILARNAIYQGRSFSEWYKRAGALSNRKVIGVVEAGFVNGDTIQQTIRNVEGVLGKSIPDIRTLVRSNMLNTSAIARREMEKQNSDIFTGKIWNSTLDVRTTPHICGIRDQAEYDLNNEPVGHSNPWGAGPSAIHFNCRSISIPIIMGVDVKAPRPSVGAGENYERGDKQNSRGKVRKPDKKSREDGILKPKVRRAGTKYENWLKSQPKDFVADALGSQEKAELFKNGIPLNRIVSDQFGTPITLQEI